MGPLFLLRYFVLFTASLGLFNVNTFAADTTKVSAPPNIVLVITDDQGYGDVAFTGNNVIKTPALDQLRRQSTLLNNFHVDPTCAPTRAALMTGRYSSRCGVWHTVQGRNMLRAREITMADILKQNGYATGLFGKWHLGDCYPYRPMDRGFEHSVYHQAGGVGQAPDYWGNDYFDDTYIVNGKHQRFEGFCTDIWFQEGINFIESNVREGRPFFAYISTNAPHSPFYCPKEYTEPYEDNSGVSRPEFYGMVTNIDDNISKLMNRLDALGVADNTIFIFMTDNGTAGGLYAGRGYDGGMRGSKNSEYEGGHRVPMLIRWVDGKIEAGKSVEKLTAHMDLLPTLINLLALKAPNINFDGTSIRDLLYTDGSQWPGRTLVVESQRVVSPIKWRKSAVMTNRWRLVNGNELFDIKADPKQKNDISDQHTGEFDYLYDQYNSYWRDVSSEHDLTSSITIGSDHSPIISLSSHDWLIDGRPPWNQRHIIDGDYAEVSHWSIKVEQDGFYEFSLRRWPVEADKGINDGSLGKAFNYNQARLCVGQVDETKDIPMGAKEVTFRVYLKRGYTKLEPTFIGSELTATPYYAYVTHKPFTNWQTPEGMGIPIYDPTYGRVPPQVSEVKPK